jgi:hypothetical protein
MKTEMQGGIRGWCEYVIEASEASDGVLYSRKQAQAQTQRIKNDEI